MICVENITCGDTDKKGNPIRWKKGQEYAGDYAKALKEKGLIAEPELAKRMLADPEHSLASGANRRKHELKLEELRNKAKKPAKLFDKSAEKPKAPAKESKK